MRKKSILVGIVLILLVIVVRVSYAYFEAQSSGGQVREVEVDTGTVDTLTFSINKDISLGINQENFGRNGENVSDTSTLTATLTPNNTTGNASDTYNLFFIMDYNDLIYTSEEELPELVIEVTDPNGNTVEQIANLEGDNGVFDITGKRKAITIVTDYPISATNNVATSQNWIVEVTAVNLATNQAANAGKKINGVLYLTKDSFSTYELPEINNVSTIDLLGASTVTDNSITVELNINSNTEELDKYYYAIEEYQDPTAMVNNGIVRLSNIVKLAVTESDYIETNSDTHTFTGLNADTKYKVYAYVVDVKGFRSNFYSTVIKTTDELPPRIVGAEITATLDSIVVDINAEDGDNEIDTYYYSIDGGNTWHEADSDHIVIDDLSPSNEYDVKIKVVDEEGNSSTEYYERVETSQYIKPVVNTVQTTTTNNSITVNVVSEEGSSNIDHYEYSIDNGNTWVEDTTPKTFAGLTSGNTYTIKIKAVDENGKESVTYTLTLQPSNYVLPTISDIYVRPFPTTMTINVTAAAGTNPIAKYYYSIQDGGDYVESTSSSYTFENLTSNAMHYIKVYAEDSTGKVSTIYNTSAKTSYLNPSVIRVDKQENSYNVVLTVTGKKGSNEIDKYYYKLSSSNEWLVSANNQITITGLTSNTAYTFDVKTADTEGHESEPFRVEAHTLYVDPTVVCSATAVDYENMLVTATVYVGSNPVTSYNFKKGSEAYKGAQATNTYTFGNLEPGTQYSFSVQVTDTEGHTATNTCRGTTNAAPTPTITFNTNGGSSVNSQTVTYKQTYGTLPTPTKDGYQFGGWYKDSGLNNVITSSTIVIDPNNHTLYAKWNANRYTIAFNKNNSSATGTTNSLTNVSYEDNVTLTTNGYSLTGYTYQGWAKTSTGAKVYNNSQTNVSVATLATDAGVQNTNNGTINLYAVWSADIYTVTLDKCSATNTPSSSAIATYNSATLSAITLPTRSHTISGFTIPTGNNAGSATVSSTSTLTSTYTFNGWYTGSCASPTTKVASNAATPALQASVSGLTNASSKWIRTDGTTLYASWTGEAKTLPTITKTGYTCGWTTTSTGATTITYASGASMTPTANTTLYGVCVIKSNLSLKVNFAGTGVSSVAVKSGSAYGTTVGTISSSGGTVTGLTYNTSYYLVPTYSTGYTLNSWAKDSGSVGTLSSTTAANPSFTIGDGTNSVTLTGKASSYTVTLNKCSATNTPSGSATATYYSTTLSAITLPTRSHTVSGFTTPTGNNAGSATVSSTTTLTSTYTFNGWYTGSCASPTTKVASNAATPALQASVSGYTDSSNRWTKTGSATLYAGWTGQAKTLPTITKTGYTCGWTTTSTGATTITYASGGSITPTANTTLYGVCVPKTYTVTLDKCSATNTPSSSATATYYATTLSSITVPTRSHTISGFTKPSGNNANGATVSSTATLTSTYTFNGWYTGSCASPTTKVASNAAAPALQASVSGYTDSSSRWTKDGTATLYAGWTGQAKTLPTITRTGYTCGWTTTSTGATTITYASGGSLTPTANMTLYGVCVLKTNLSLKINFAGTGVSSVAVKSGSASGTTVGTVSSSGGTVTGLTYNTAYYLVPTYSTGYQLNSWAKDSGSVGTLSSTTAANPSFTIGDGTNSVTLTGKAKTYTVTLNNCSATNTPSSSATATYYATTLSAITVPTRSHTINGFTTPSGNNASGATVSSTTTLTSTYTFNGWYTGSCASPTTKVASNASTPALQASVSGYTDSSKRWTKDGTATLYAGWTGQAKTLPTITKTGYTCGWTTTSTGATTITYASGASMTPTKNTWLYGVCTANKYNIKFTFDSGISSVVVKSGSTTVATISTSGNTASLTYGTTYTITVNYKSNYYANTLTLSTGSGTLTDNSYTVGAGTATIAATSKTYVYWNDNLSGTEYASNATPSTTYATRAALASAYGTTNFNNNNIYVRSSKSGNTVLGHEVCLWYNNGEVCVGAKYWVGEGTDNNPYVSCIPSILAAMNSAFGTSITESNCSGDSFSGECYINGRNTSKNGFEFWRATDSYVYASSGKYCYVDRNGVAACK